MACDMGCPNGCTTMQYVQGCKFHDPNLETKVDKFRKEMYKSTIEVLRLIQSIPDADFERIFKNPEEIKPLDQLLSDTHFKNPGPLCWYEVSNAAINWFIDVLHSTEWYDLGQSFGYSSPAHYKQRVIEKLNKHIKS